MLIFNDKIKISLSICMDYNCLPVRFYFYNYLRFLYVSLLLHPHEKLIVNNKWMCISYILVRY